MSHSDQLSDWANTVSINLPKLSRTQAFMLAAWSFAMLNVRAIGVTACASFLAELWSQPLNTTRQRLREFYFEATAKAGRGRQDIVVADCFAPLLQWLVSRWPSNHAQLALALDATALGDQLVVLSCAVLYRGCAIPVAWKVMPANTKGAWKPHWLAMLEQLDEVVSKDWTVLVMADCGLYARWLYERIVNNGWHPFLRIQRQGQYRVAGQAKWRNLAKLPAQAGQEWSGAVSCFSGENGGLECTLLARWEEGQERAWLVLTDLAPAGADIVWYGMRFWIECGFKDLKRSGWHWEQTRMREVGRVERQWLALAVATLLVVSAGGASEENEALAGVAEQVNGAGLVRARRGRLRAVSCFVRGLHRLLVRIVRGEWIDIAVFWPEEWPRAEQRVRLQWADLDYVVPPQAAAA